MTCYPCFARATNLTLVNIFHSLDVKIAISFVLRLDEKVSNCLSRLRIDDIRSGLDILDRYLDMFAIC